MYVFSHRELPDFHTHNMLVFRQFLFSLCSWNALIYS